jgi:hypothetical protein
MPASATFSGFLGPEVLASSSRAWFAPPKPKTAKLREQYADWLASEEAFLETASERVYTNDEISPLDLRFHLGAIASAIASGQSLILEVLALRGEGAVAPDFFTAEIATLDEHISALVRRLNEWHGTIDSQADIPESLKQAFREAATGDVIPFPNE